MACIFVVPFGLKGLGFQQEVAWVTLHGDRLHAREQRSKINHSFVFPGLLLLAVYPARRG